MSWVMVSSRVPGKTSRTRVESVDFKGSVAVLKSKASRALDLPINEIELIYSGQQLKDQELVSKYGIKPGVTVHVLKKTILEEHGEIPEKLDNAAIQQVVGALQTALLNPAYRTVMMENAETLGTLIASTPGLDKDPVAMAMLQNPELLAHIVSNPRQVHRVIEAHPCLGQAALSVAAAVTEEGSRGGSGRGASARATYSLDQMSDDEDSGQPGRPRAGTSGQSAQSITYDQLAAALAASVGSGLPPSTVPSGATPSTSSAAQSAAASSSAITASALGQALQAAASSQQPPRREQPVTPVETPVVTEAALQQLRDMGITDEAVARRALEASGGDIHAALGLIFDM